MNLYTTLFYILSHIYLLFCLIFKQAFVRVNTSVTSTPLILSPFILNMLLLVFVYKQLVRFQFIYITNVENNVQLDFANECTDKKIVKIRIFVEWFEGFRNLRVMYTHKNC